MSVKFSPDSKTIATASFDKTVKLWNLEGTLLQTFQGHEDWVWSVNFSPDGKKLASASRDYTVRFWKVPEKKSQPLNLNELLEKGCQQVRDYLETKPLCQE